MKRLFLILAAMFAVVATSCDNNGAGPDDVDDGNTTNQYDIDYRACVIG